jgi:glycosyltransferase involved in cell wall biosynthesis
VGAPHPSDPCLDTTPRGPLPGGRRVRVVEVMATGTNGGAQEHVYGLLRRLDTSRYDASLVSLSPGSAVRAIERLGVPVLVLDEPDDAIATGALATHLADTGAEVVHNHMYRAELVGTRAAIALGEAGHRRPWVIGTVHSSRIRSAEDRSVLAHLTESMDHLVAVSRSIVHKIDTERPSRTPISLIHNGVDMDRYAHQDPCCTLRDEYGMEPDAQIVGVVARLEPEKGHATLLDAWPRVVARVPRAYLLVVGEGSRREPLEDQAARLGISGHVIFTGRREDVPAVTAALDLAILPSYREAQGLTILEAMALSRPVIASNVGGIPEMVEDGRTGLLVPPRDPVALAGAIVRLLTDHAYADLLARAGHELVHEQFCVERMVRALEDLYDAGALAVRESLNSATGRPALSPGATGRLSRRPVAGVPGAGFAPGMESVRAGGTQE